MHGFSAAIAEMVERMPQNSKALGLIPSRYLAFSSSILSSFSLNRFLKEVQCYCFPISKMNTQLGSFGQNEPIKHSLGSKKLITWLNF